MKDTVLQLNTASSVSANHDVNHSRLLLSQSADLSSINGRVGSVQTSMDTVQDVVMTMNERMEQNFLVSGAQGEDIRTVLLALQNQISLLSNQPTNTHRTSHPRSIHISENSNALEEDSELMKSIERLRSVDPEKEWSAHDEEAEPFIDDLNCVLNAMLALPADRNGTSSKRKVDALGEAEDLSAREIKRLCGILASSRSINLNSRRKLHLHFSVRTTSYTASQAPRSGPAANQKVLQKHKTKK